MIRKSLIALLAGVCVVCSAWADYSVTGEGKWPKSWPQELEALRKQSTTFQGGTLDLMHFVIPFTKRDEFEAAWPHILKVKSKGSPLILLSGSDESQSIFKLKAGVRVRCPPTKENASVSPSASTVVKETTLPDEQQTAIYLIVDGDIVDLNRIPFPPHTVIIDRRFNDSKTK